MLGRRWFLALGAAALLSGVIIHLFGVHQRRTDPDAIRQRVKALETHHGITIGYGGTDTFFVPPYTVNDAHRTNVVTSAARFEVLGPALDGIEESLGSYPPGFFRRLCAAIFISGGLTIDGAPAGGTYGPAWIVLVADERLGDEVNRETARLGVHHEFSSLVWHHVAGLPPRWIGLLPPNWKEAKDNAEALKASDRGFIDLASGFLSPYGATDPENDFNTYAERLFTDAGSVARLADRHSVIAKKLSLLMGAYNSIDQRMDEVFDRLDLARFRAVLEQPVDEAIHVFPVQIPTPQIVRPPG
jgi:hypothetical protein